MKECSNQDLFVKFNGPKRDRRNGSTKM